VSEFWSVYAALFTRVTPSINSGFNSSPSFIPKFCLESMSGNLLPGCVKTATVHPTLYCVWGGSFLHVRCSGVMPGRYTFTTSMGRINHVAPKLSRGWEVTSHARYLIRLKLVRYDVFPLFWLIYSRPVINHCPFRRHGQNVYYNRGHSCGSPFTAKISHFKVLPRILELSFLEMGVLD